MKQKYKEGFSLVELLLAMAITSIVLLGMVALISYGSHSSRTTQARVALQDEAKDVVNHISTYVQEGNASVTWDDSAKMLMVRKDTIQNEGSAAATVSSVDAYIYWMAADSDGKKHIYFADATQIDTAFDPKVKTSTFDTSLLTADKTHLLSDDVDDFTCELKKSVDDATKKVLHVVVNMKDDYSKFDCEKDILMRNQ